MKNDVNFKDIKITEKRKEVKMETERDKAVREIHESREVILAMHNCDKEVSVFFGVNIFSKNEKTKKLEPGVRKINFSLGKNEIFSDTGQYSGMLDPKAISLVKDILAGIVDYRRDRKAEEDKMLEQPQLTKKVEA